MAAQSDHSVWSLKLRPRQQYNFRTPPLPPGDCLTAVRIHRDFSTGYPSFFSLDKNIYTSLIHPRNPHTPVIGNI